MTRTRSWTKGPGVLGAALLLAAGVPGVLAAAGPGGENPTRLTPSIMDGDPSWSRGEILALIAGGHDNAEVAGRLFPSLKTVQNHVSSIFRKLRVADRVQAALRAREAGLGD